MGFHFSSSRYTDRWPICFILYLSTKDYKFTKDTASPEMDGRNGRKAGGCAARKHHPLPFAPAARLSRALIWQKQQEGCALLGQPETETVPGDMASSYPDPKSAARQVPPLRC